MNTATSRIATSRRSRAPLETWGCSHQPSRRRVRSDHGEWGRASEEAIAVMASGLGFVQGERFQAALAVLITAPQIDTAGGQLEAVRQTGGLRHQDPPGQP